MSLKKIMDLDQEIEALRASLDLLLAKKEGKSAPPMAPPMAPKAPPMAPMAPPMAPVAPPMAPLVSPSRSKSKTKVAKEDESKEDVDARKKIEEERKKVLLLRDQFLKDVFSGLRKQKQKGAPGYEYLLVDASAAEAAAATLDAKKKRRDELQSRLPDYLQSETIPLNVVKVTPFQSGMQFLARVRILDPTFVKQWAEGKIPKEDVILELKFNEDPNVMIPQTFFLKTLGLEEWAQDLPTLFRLEAPPKKAKKKGVTAKSKKVGCTDAHEVASILQRIDSKSLPELMKQVSKLKIDELNILITCLKVLVDPQSTREKNMAKEFRDVKMTPQDWEVFLLLEENSPIDFPQGKEYLRVLSKKLLKNDSITRQLEEEATKSMNRKCQWGRAKVEQSKGPLSKAEFQKLAESNDESAITKFSKKLVEECFNNNYLA